MQDKLISHIIPQNEALKFITAGNSIFTFVFNKEEVRYTYKAISSTDQMYLSIKLLTGPDNTKHYSDIYFFNVSREGLPVLTYRINNKVYETSQSVVLFKKVFRSLILRPDEEIYGLEIWHEGRCCRCGRTLTVPESIANGIGPECITKQNSFVI